MCAHLSFRRALKDAVGPITVPMTAQARPPHGVCPTIPISRASLRCSSFRQRNQIAFQRIIQKNAAVDSSIHHDQIRSVRAHLQQFDHVGGHAALLAGALKHLATLIDGRPHEWASWHRARAYQEHDTGGIAGVRVRYELHHVIVERDPAVLAPMSYAAFRYRPSSAWKSWRTTPEGSARPRPAASNRERTYPPAAPLRWDRACAAHNRCTR